MTEAEWTRLRDALAALPAHVRDDVVARTHAASIKRSGPVTCPMLDLARGACLVYAARPVACRTYGFYAERDAGLHCGEVTRLVEENDATGSVLWGNGEAIAEDMKVFGEIASLHDWMSR